LAFVRRFAAAAGNRLRLLPPYREHLSQGLLGSLCVLASPLTSPNSSDVASRFGR
jgi:hypothetical protein